MTECISRALIWPWTKTAQCENMSTSTANNAFFTYRVKLRLFALYLCDLSKLIQKAGVDVKDAEDGDIKREQNAGEYLDFVKSRKQFPGSPRYVGVVYVLQV